jgi:hypothetical protein
MPKWYGWSSSLASGTIGCAFMSVCDDASEFVVPDDDAVCAARSVFAFLLQSHGTIIAKADEMRG